MTRKFLTAAFLAVAGVTAGCSIQPPSDGNLGPQVSVDAINQVLDQAQSGVSQSQAFHVGDTGTVQIIDTVMDSSSVQETDTYQITSIDSGNINYLMHQVDTNTCYEGQIPVESASASTSPTPKPSTTDHATPLFDRLFVPLARVTHSIKKTLSRFFARVTIQPATALGSGGYKIKPTVDARLKIPAHLRSIAVHKLDAGVSANEENETLSGPVPCSTNGTAQPTPTPSSTGSPNPTPTTDSGGNTSDGLTHQYYNLTYYTHQFVTQNCSQLPNCEASSTHVEFDDVETDQSGNSNRVHWLYEISVQVPGLFVIMEECYSTLEVEQGQVLPLTSCQNVENFQFGTTTN